MVTMSGVWDRTVEVIAARRSLLVGLTLLLIWLPGLILSALRFAVLGVAAADQGNAGAPWLGVLGLVVTLVAVVGQLALVAAASDAATGRREAVAVALRRFGPYVGMVLLFALVAGVAILATRGVVGVALRLIFGFQGMTTALFLTGAIVSLVGCAVSLVVTTFTARLYVAIVGTDSAGSGGRWPAA